MIIISDHVSSANPERDMTERHLTLVKRLKSKGTVGSVLLSSLEKKKKRKSAF